VLHVDNIHVVCYKALDSHAAGNNIIVLLKTK
jgi:hypothetical protein